MHVRLPMFPNARSPGANGRGRGCIRSRLPRAVGGRFRRPAAALGRCPRDARHTAEMRMSPEEVFTARLEDAEGSEADLMSRAPEAVETSSR